MSQSEASQFAGAKKLCKIGGNRALHASNIFCRPKAQIPGDSQSGLRRRSGEGILASYWLNPRHAQKLAVWCRAESRMRAGNASNAPLEDWWHLLAARTEVFLGQTEATRRWLDIALNNLDTLTSFCLEN